MLANSTTDGRGPRAGFPIWLRTASGLFVLSALVQFVLITRAPLPGLDAVRFTALARQIDELGLLAAMSGQVEQPIYPVWLWLVHRSLTALSGPSPSSWATAVCWAAGLPAALAVVPVYLAALRLVGPRKALAGSTIFCVLPEIARLGADGISDSSHLLLFSLGFWALVAAFEAHGRRLIGWFLAAGLLFGLATLTRAESILVLPALGISLFWLTATRIQATRTRLQTPRVAAAKPERPTAPLIHCLSGTIVFAAAMATVLAAFCCSVGATAPRAAVDRLLGRPVENANANHLREAQNRPATLGLAPRAELTAAVATEPIAAGSDRPWLLPDGEPMSFRPKDPTHSLRRRGWAAAVAQFVEELADAFGYVGIPFLVLGAWQRRRLQAAERFAQSYCVLLTLVVIAFAAREGYVDARHLATWVVPCVGCLGGGIVGLAARSVGWYRLRGLAKFAELVRRPGLPGTGRGHLTASPVVATIMVALVAACLVQLRSPLHAGRAAHRRAAEWLASRAAQRGFVLDSRGWTGLYSGWQTYLYEEAPLAFADRRLCYVVLETDELGLDTARSRTIETLLQWAAEPAAVFVDHFKNNHVAVFRWYPERLDEQSFGTLGHKMPDRHRTSRHSATRFHKNIGGQASVVGSLGSGAECIEHGGGHRQRDRPRRVGT